MTLLTGDVVVVVVVVVGCCRLLVVISVVVVVVAVVGRCCLFFVGFCLTKSGWLLCSIFIHVHKDNHCFHVETVFMYSLCVCVHVCLCDVVDDDDGS